MREHHGITGDLNEGASWDNRGMNEGASWDNRGSE